MGHDAVEPRQDRPSLVVLVPAFVGPSEGDLGRIGCCVLIAQDPEGQTVQVRGVVTVGLVDGS